MPQLSIIFVVLNIIHACYAFTPFFPTSGYTYYIEAIREKNWPSCSYRFISYPNSCDAVDLWNAAGSNQEWTVVSAGEDTFYLKNGCGQYLSYPGDCNSHIVDTWAQAGVNQAFKFISDGASNYEFYIEAVGRQNCDYKWLSFPQSCTTSSPDKVDLYNAAGIDQRFRIFPVRSSNHVSLPLNSDTACADPYAWYSEEDDKYFLQCTFGGLALSSTSSISPSSIFRYQGDSLGGTPSSWAANTGDRWAPENVQVGAENYVFFADSQPDGIHRIGWSMSSSGVKVNAWSVYSSTYLSLGNTAGGEIDGSVYSEWDGGGHRYYLVWKSDDNNVGAATTRIWAQEMTLGNSSVSMIGSPKVIMDSTGLWWIDSWVAGGSLVEGPEIYKRNDYYYLFFASGKYCQDSYAEGVARSKSLWGPYEKLGTPLLSTGSVGYANGQKLVGPGHASYVTDAATGNLYAIYHASIGENCNRYPFVARVEFGVDNWPYIEW